MINPAMVAFLLKGKLDEIIAGDIPDGLKVKTKTDQQIVLVPDNIDQMVEGVEIKEITIAVVYKGVSIQLKHE